MSDEPLDVCHQCSTRYAGDPERLRLGNRLCVPCQAIPRSTCFDCSAHPAHNWDKGDAKLWCPGTDGSNPQVPSALAKELEDIAALGDDRDEYGSVQP